MRNHLPLLVAGLAAGSLLSSCSNGTPQPTGLPVGSACTAASDCSSPPEAVCYTEYKPLKGLINEGTDEELKAEFEAIGLDFPGGYCSNAGSCAQDSDCSSGGKCYLAMAGVSQETIDELTSTVPFDVNTFKTLGLCMKPCTEDDECRQGYKCGWPLGDLMQLVEGAQEAKFCIQIPDPCKGAPCKNEGTCAKVDDLAYECTCKAGFTGTTCETNVDDCAAGPCLNGGTCTDGVDDYTCACPAGFTGDSCETNVDDCTPNPCQNGGTCQDGVDDYTCDCEGDWGGKDCDQELTGCSPNPCQNGGTCTPGVGGAYTCDCPAGFGGPTCETALVSCDPNPCLNGGTCDMVAGLPVCSCPLGYSGDTCEVEVCTPNPCQNAGTCAPAAGGGFTCSCTGGWTGPTCETAPKCGDYTDVIYRLSGQFRVKTAIGTNNYDLGDNSTTPAFEDATNVTPFASGGTFTAGFARLRFENDDAGNPKAGTVSLVEWYFPLNYQQTAGATLNVDTDHSVGLLAAGLSNCGAGDEACTAHAPTLARACTANAQGTLSGTTLAWGACAPATTGANGWDYADARAATGPGCAASWTAFGRSGPCTAGMCSAVPACSLGDSYQTWNQELKPLEFDGTDFKTAGFTMPHLQLPNCTTGFAATVTSLSVTEATVIGTQCGSTPGTDLVCDVQ